jgi:hypothetical protein
MVSVGRRGFGASSAGRVDIPLAAVTLLDALQMASMRIGDTMEVSAWSQCGSLRSPPQSLFVVVAGSERLVGVLSRLDYSSQLA